MITTKNGTTTMGRTFFRYLRPAVNGFGTTDEPDVDVARAINDLVTLLGKGFVDRNDSNDEAALRSLRDKLKSLENEDENGTRTADREFKRTINLVEEAKIKLNNAENERQTASVEIKKAQDILNALIKKQRTFNNNKPDNDDNTTDARAAYDDIKIEIAKAKADLKAKEGEGIAAEKKVLLAKNTLVECEANEKTAMAELSRIEKEVASDTDETVRYIKDYSEKVKDRNDYSKQLSLKELPGQNGLRTKFKMKIGNNSSLNTPFILVEEKIGKSSLSFNASLFLKYDVIREFLFLRAILIDGLKDEDAIYDRIIDENEGGIKYLYNYIVEIAIAKIIKAKKLNDD